MTLPLSTFTTYQAIGNREDLSDVIYQIDPTDTPFITGIERENAKAVLHEWQTQALASPNTSNALLEGDDAVTITITPTVRLTNVCQISGKVGRVTGTQESVDHAGRSSELAFLKANMGLELRRDMESIVVGTNQAKVTGGGTTARLTASVLSWIKTNGITAVGGSNPLAALGADLRTDATTPVAFTEVKLKSSLSSIWTNGGKPDTIMTGAFNKQVFSTFTGRATPTEDTTAKKITASVDAYESDFGMLNVVANRFQRARDVLILQMDMWALGYLPGRKMVTQDLAKTGDSERFSILSEYVLTSRNEKASGGVFDNTSS